MNKKYVSLASLIGVILICSCCAFQCISSGFFSTENPTARAPIRVLTIETDADHRDELCGHLRSFAEEHNLEVETAFYTNKKCDGQFFYVMYGENLQISAYFTPDRRTSDVSFFEKTKGIPPRQEYLDEIFDDLKVYFSEIPGVVILKEK